MFSGACQSRRDSGSEKGELVKGVLLHPPIFMTDPLSDFFIRIKNAQKAGHKAVHLPYSKLKHEIASLLEHEGWVGAVIRIGKRAKKTLEIQLIEKDGQPAIRGVTLLSRPSRRVFVPCRSLRPPRHGGIIIISTSRGITTSREARSAGLGGQLIAEIF